MSEPLDDVQTAIDTGAAKCSRSRATGLMDGAIEDATPKTPGKPDPKPLRRRSALIATSMS
jgi:hypothetical protein